MGRWHQSLKLGPRPNHHRYACTVDVPDNMLRHCMLAGHRVAGHGWHGAGRGSAAGPTVTVTGWVAMAVVCEASSRHCGGGACRGGACRGGAGATRVATRWGAGACRLGRRRRERAAAARGQHGRGGARSVTRRGGRGANKRGCGACAWLVFSQWLGSAASYGLIFVVIERVNYHHGRCARDKDSAPGPG